MKTVFKTILFFVILVGLFVVYKFYFAKEETVKYESIKVQTMDITQSIDAIGEIFPISSVNVGSEVSGQIKKMFVKVGDVVKKGDKIANIDDVKQKNELKNQEAALQINRARLNSSKISYEITRKKYDREKMLFKNSATSKDSLENAQNSYMQARAALKENEALIVQTKISLKTAKTNLSYTKIVAPLSGTILAISAKEGQTLNVNQNTPNIVAIANLETMEVKMRVSQGDVNKIHKNQKIVFNILADDKKIHATISSIDPANTNISDNTTVSNTSSSSSAVYYYAKYKIDNRSGLFKIGMTTQNKILLKEAKNALAIPFSTIKRRDGKVFVDILKDDDIKEREIILGIDDGINVEVKKGLNENDVIVVQQSSLEDTNSQESELFF